MLHLFRKYQRYIYFVVTVVIIISFSFFGTYNTLGNNNWREQIAFKAVNGQEIPRADVDEMSFFLATDNADKIAYGGAWGPNFLNDGVISKDFMETGLAQELILAYSDDVKDELQKKSAKEKKYTLYTNPQVSFIGVEGAWSYFAPNMKTYFNALRNANDPTSADAIDNRVKLYLSEKQFPGSMIKRVLRYQEKQFSWLTPDPSLDQTDLSLFGYRNLNDWFGPEFSAMVSQFIINAAILAEAKGYTVTKAEALADLGRNTQNSFRENMKNPNIGVASPQEYFNEQLRLLNMEQSRAIKIWQQVMLFRRYFQDAGHSALVDTLAFQKFNQFANETVTAEVYRLPSGLRMTDLKGVQKYEAYLKAVAKPTKGDYPTEFLTAAQVSKTYPELVQKRYSLEVSQVNQKLLQARVGIKEMWSWESDAANWDALKKKFPDLGIKPGSTSEERFAALEDLDTNTRERVDAFAKESIVNQHPEWIDQALSQVEPKKVVVGIRTEGKKAPLDGLDTKEKREKLIKLLDTAQVGQAPERNSPLYAYTPDNLTFYRISVLDRAKDTEVLSFADANADGTLNDIRDKLLEKYYVENREKKPEVYQGENKEWLPFANVKEVVADDFFAGNWDKIEPLRDKLTATDPIYKSMGKDQLAALHFYPYVKKVQDQIQKDPKQADKFVKGDKKETEADKLPAGGQLADQWLLEKEVVVVSRQDNAPVIDVEKALVLPQGSWSDLNAPFNGDLVFFQVKDKGIKDPSNAAVVEQTRKAQAQLSASAQRVLMQKVLGELKAKNAITLAYLKTPAEQPEVINSQEIESSDSF